MRGKGKPSGRVNWRLFEFRNKYKKNIDRKLAMDLNSGVPMDGDDENSDLECINRDKEDWEAGTMGGEDSDQEEEEDSVAEDISMDEDRLPTMPFPVRQKSVRRRGSTRPAMFSRDTLGGNSPF